MQYNSLRKLTSSFNCKTYNFCIFHFKGQTMNINSDSNSARNGSKREDPRKIRPDTDGRDEKGRFAAGNAGRPSGSKNRTTAIARALLLEEGAELVTKGIALAKAGDVQMLKFFLDRLLPKERLIQLDLPDLDFADDAIDAMAAVSGAITNGQITTSEGTALAGMICGYSRVHEVAELSQRIDKLEASLKAEDEQ
jgi:hypothetical protein